MESVTAVQLSGSCRIGRALCSTRSSLAATRFVSNLCPIHQGPEKHTNTKELYVPFLYVPFWRLNSVSPAWALRLLLVDQAAQVEPVALHIEVVHHEPK